MGSCIKGPSYKQGSIKNKQLQQTSNGNGSQQVIKSGDNGNQGDKSNLYQTYFPNYINKPIVGTPKQQTPTDQSRLGNERLQKQQQQLIQRMKKDGINQQDYAQYNSLFRQCPCCSKLFSQDQKPILRECGHFVCNQNQCRSIACFFPKCGKNSQTKIFAYWPYIQGSQYNFIINSGEGNQEMLYNQNGAQTFQQLISKTNFAKHILKGSNTYGIMVGTKYEIYDNLRNCTISSKAKALGLQTSNLGITKNRIYITDKKQGGTSNQLINQIQTKRQNKQQKLKNIFYFQRAEDTNKQIFQYDIIKEKEQLIKGFNC